MKWTPPFAWTRDGGVGDPNGPWRGPIIALTAWVSQFLISDLFPGPRTEFLVARITYWLPMKAQKQQCVAQFNSEDKGGTDRLPVFRPP